MFCIYTFFFAVVQENIPFLRSQTERLYCNVSFTVCLLIVHYDNNLKNVLRGIKFNKKIQYLTLSLLFQQFYSIFFSIC